MAKSKVLPIENLKSGMVLSRPIVTKRGQTIAKAGTVLSHSLINRLSFYKIESAEVENDFTDDPDYQESRNRQMVPPVMPVTVEMPVEEEIVIEEVAPVEEAVPEKTEKYVSDSLSYTAKMQQSSEFQSFQVDFMKNIANLKNTFDEIKNGATHVDTTALLAECSKLFSSKTPLQLFTLMHTMKSMDDSVYAHSINVALIARSMGRWLRLPKERLDKLTLAGLLHDIGKLQIPDEVLNKTEKLTDEEFNLIRQHPVLGNKMLKSVGADSYLCTCALQHHERFDESGYPRRLPGDEIDDYAAIIAIADVYDAMTASRSYRQPKSPFEVIHEFERDGYQKYHPKYIMTFLSHIASLYLNAQVLLNDGRKARVVFINRNKLSAPIVELLDTKDTLELSKEKKIQITKIL